MVIDVNWREKYREKARKVLDKPSKYGVDVDIKEYMPQEIREEPSLAEYRDLLESVGIEVEEKNRSGSYYQIESQVISAISKQPGLEILSIEEAIDRYGDELKDYYWRTVHVDQDKYTAIAELRGSGGYYIRVKKGYKISFPIQACLLMEMNKSLQAPHNIIIAEENSEASIITGCAAMKEMVGLHAGITEIYVGENARVNYIMIHKWNRAMHIRPRTGVLVGRNGVYVSHYIAFTEMKSYQSMPRVILNEGARAYLSSTIVLDGDSRADSGYELILKEKRSSGQIISRSLTKGNSEIVTRAIISGEAPEVKGHIDCQGLLLSDKSRILTIPILDAKYDDVMLTHEAAVGKLSEEKILWLIARGFRRDEAEGLLIKGFMKTEIPGLPEGLEKMIRYTSEKIAKSII